MKEKIFIFLLVLPVVLAACTRQNQEATKLKSQDSTSQESTNQSKSTTIAQEVDSVIILGSISTIDSIQTTKPKSCTPSQTKYRHQTSTQSTSAASSRYSYEDDDDDEDYYDNLRKYSPNDNYLLGFDEDVDDVHDMEIYMEDY